MNCQPAILCIDDDLDTCELLAFTLARSGYQVKKAHTVEEALRKAQQEQFALYSIDRHLPDGSGVDLCQHIRQFDPHTPIIFFSAEAFPEEIQNALKAGAQAYLVKPTDPDELTKTVTTLLTHH
jgi:two-component system response regulator PilR (NtrC family)